MQFLVFFSFFFSLQSFHTMIASIYFENFVFAFVCFVAQRSEDLGLFVLDEEDNETLLAHRISSDDIYRKQEGITDFSKVLAV